MPYYVNLMADPVTTGPQVVEPMKRDGTIYFRSWEFDPPPPPIPPPDRGDNPPGFVIQVPDPGNNFLNFINSGTSSPNVVVGAGVNRRIDFASTPRVRSGDDCEEVKIKFRVGGPARPAEGFKYNVLMNGLLLDPRLRPR